jgi:hypothetical protein
MRQNGCHSPLCNNNNSSILMLFPHDILLHMGAILRTVVGCKRRSAYPVVLTRPYSETRTIPFDSQNHDVRTTV